MPGERPVLPHFVERELRERCRGERLQPAPVREEAMRRRGSWPALFAVVAAQAACNGAPAATPPQSTNPRPPFRFEVVADVAPPCPEFWSGSPQPPGSLCAQARGALHRLYEPPSGDEGAAVQSLDRLCAGGIAEACDAGRELLWLCTAEREEAWRGACDMLAAAKRSFPRSGDTDDWTPGALPGHLSGCHIVQAGQTCGVRGNAYLDPNPHAAACVTDPPGCEPPDPGRVELDSRSHASHCDEKPLQIAQVGAVHCFDSDRWSFRGPGGSWRTVAVTWYELRGFEAVGAVVRPGGMVLTLEGTGARPMLRVGFSRMWLREPDEARSR